MKNEAARMLRTANVAKKDGDWEIHQQAKAEAARIQRENAVVRVKDRSQFRGKGGKS